MMKESWTKTLDDFSGCSAKLFQTAGRISPEDLDLAPDDGGWSIRQIIHHLADGISIWGIFIRQAQAGRGGEFDLHWYWEVPQDEWAEIWSYTARDIQPSLKLYQANQEHILSLVQGIENPADFQLEINIPEHEASIISIQEAIESQIRHLDGHLEDIQSILNAKE